MAEVAIEKLTKKQRKALEFRKKKSGQLDDAETKQETTNNDKKRVRDILSEAGQGNDNKSNQNDDSKNIQQDGATVVTNPDGEPVKKKRKTRRGKKGKGSSNGVPRFILFVGNLPYNTTEDELRQLFKHSKPDIIRMRKDKGIAFVEFNESTIKSSKNKATKKDGEQDKDSKDGEDKDSKADGKQQKKEPRASSLRSRMDIALTKHHAIFKNRKINVELTAGGGGNSQARLEKIKEKNLKLDEERREKLAKSLEEQRKKRNNGGSSSSSHNTGSSVGGEQPTTGIHPSRLAMMKKK